MTQYFLFLQDKISLHSRTMEIIFTEAKREKTSQRGTLFFSSSLNLNPPIIMERVLLGYLAFSILTVLGRQNNQAI